MSFRKQLQRFRREQRGSVAIMAAMVLSIATGAAVFAIDHATVAQSRVNLQNAVDEAALTTVRGLRFVRSGSVAYSKDADDGTRQTDTSLTSIADSVVRSYLNDRKGGLKTDASRTDEDAVRVFAKLQVDTPFGGLTGLDDLVITASAEAQLFGARNICVMALGAGENVGVNLEQSAFIKAGECGIYSNSNSVSSVNLLQAAKIESTFVCAAGGYTGAKTSVSTEVLTDCPQVTDPLMARPIPPAPEVCDHNYTILTGDAVEILEPGRYCGGLIIQDNVQVTMKPGIYQMTGGLFIVQGNAKLQGDNVSIIMDGASGSIYFNDAADVNLSAPVDGSMAGIVIASRSVCDGEEDCHMRVFEIKSSRVSSLLGTIYVPEDRFIINTSTPISGEAAFTIILARFVQGQQSPTLVLNTDYGATDVPVPDGFIGSKGSRLTR